jgi:hypothetical protein
VGEPWVKRVVAPHFAPHAGAMEWLNPNKLFHTIMAASAAIAVLGAVCMPAGSENKPASVQPIKVGFVWGVTGAIAEIVRPASDASEAYFDYLN